MKLGQTVKTIGLLVVALGALSGCAANKTEQVQQANTAVSNSNSSKNVPDPFESVNRVMWDFNYDVLDRFLLKPLTKGYVAVMPQFVRSSLVNASDNLEEPANMVNNLLQGKPSQSANSLSRFIVNSTVGVLGIFDVASKMGIAAQPEDFGQVLGVWGVGTGPYLMIPGLGPNDVRSLSGRVVDNIYWPLTVIDSQYVVASTVVSVLEARANLLEQEANLTRSLDPYLFVRDAYFQRLAFEVSDGKVAAPTQEEVEAEADDFEDFENMLKGL